MSTVITDISMPCSKGCNSNNSSSNYAILTQYRRHLYIATIPNSIMGKYKGSDIESAFYNFHQTATLSNNIYVRSYWTYYNSTACPFGTGTTEDVSTNADAWPNTTAEQPQYVHAGSKTTKNSYSVDLTKIFKHIFDRYNPDPNSTGSATYGIWSRFGRSGYATGSTTNLGGFTLVLTVSDGNVFVFNGETWEKGSLSCYNDGTWKENCETTIL